MARATWRGAFSFAGFPIHVQAFSLLKTRSADSFKTLAPTNDLPVRQVLVDSDGTVVERDECGKGVELAKGKYAKLPREAVEMIQSAERSTTLEPATFAPRASVPLNLATGHYRLVPDEKVPGSDGPVGILWNGLMASDRVLVTEWTPRAGSRNALFAVYADERGLEAATLPYTSDFNDVPAWEPQENEQAAQMFEQFASLNYAMDDFDHQAFTDAYAERRKDAIQKALNGEVIEAPATAEDTAPPVPDLMAAMAASLEAAQGTGRKAQVKAAADAKAKAEANGGRKAQVRKATKTPA